MGLTVLTILCLLVFNFTFDQDREKYSELIKTVLSLYKSIDYLKSRVQYSKAFITLSGNGIVNDRYKNLKYKQ
jgi:hypothetical protein